MIHETDVLINGGVNMLLVPGSPLVPLVGGRNGLGKCDLKGMTMFFGTEYDLGKDPIEARRRHPRTGAYQWCILRGKKATRWFSSPGAAWAAWEMR